MPPRDRNLKAAVARWRRHVHDWLTRPVERCTLPKYLGLPHVVGEAARINRLENLIGLRMHGVVRATALSIDVPVDSWRRTPEDTLALARAMPPLGREERAWDGMEPT